MATGSGRVVLVCLLLSFLPVAESTEFFVDNCGYTYDLMDEDEIVFDLSSNAFYGNNLSCDVTFVTSSDHMLVFLFESVDLDSCSDSLYVYEDFIAPFNELSWNLCFAAREVFVTSSSTGIVELQSDAFGHMGGFRLIVSSFTYTGIDDQCPSGYSKCTNSRCIRTSLVCNSRDNCGDNSDEPWDCNFPLWAIILICVGVVGVIVCVIFFVVIIVKSNHLKQMKNKRVHVLQPTQGVAFHSMQQGPPPSQFLPSRTPLPTIPDTPYFPPHPGSPPPPIVPSSVAPPSGTFDNVPPPANYLDHEQVPGPAVYNLPPTH